MKPCGHQHCLTHNCRHAHSQRNGCTDNAKNCLRRDRRIILKCEKYSNDYHWTNMLWRIIARSASLTTLLHLYHSLSYIVKLVAYQKSKSNYVEYCTRRPFVHPGQYPTQSQKTRIRTFFILMIESENFSMSSFCSGNCLKTIQSSTNLGMTWF